MSRKVCFNCGNVQMKPKNWVSIPTCIRNDVVVSTGWLCINCQCKKNTKGLGQNQKHLLKFAQRAGGWQTFAQDHETVRTVNSLKRRNLIVVNKLNQFRLAK